ncbi:MAG: TetR/AcrR family transcriptional regulator [Blastocatellia bacterium]|nr:TetR/AcrR family transcriptional regulator [Blastocatellia bacterium]
MTKPKLQIQTDRPRLDRIYIAAAEVIHAKGYHATSMDDIAKAAKITKPGLYYYIRSKDELLFNIMMFTLDGYERRVVTPAREIADPEERLRSMIANHVLSIVENGQVLTILTEEMAGLEAENLRTIKERKRGFLRFIRGTLKELKALGRLRNVDVTLAALGMQGMIMWLSYWYKPNGPVSKEEAAAQYCEILMNGLLLPKAGPKRRGK